MSAVWFIFDVLLCTGGELFIKAFAGRDASEAYISYHRRKFPHSKWQHAAVGKGVPLKDDSADEDFLELCEQVEKVLPTYKSFAPPSYFIKVFIILGSAFGLEVNFFNGVDVVVVLVTLCLILNVLFDLNSSTCTTTKHMFGIWQL